MATLETRLANAVVAGLKANATFVLLMGSNVEFQISQGALTDETLGPGEGRVIPGAPDPLTEEGNYDDSRRSAFTMTLEIRTQVDPTLGGTAQQTRFYQALNEVFGDAQKFLATVSDPEANMLVVDGEVDIEPGPPVSEDEEDAVELEADIVITVDHKKVMTE